MEEKRSGSGEFRSDSAAKKTVWMAAAGIAGTVTIPYDAVLIPRPRRLVMALSDATRDRLVSLGVAAEGLMKYANSAADNANSDSLTADPMMRAVRSGWLLLDGIAREFLTLTGTGGITRFASDDVRTQIDALATAVQITAQEATDIKAVFTAGAQYTANQIRSRLFPFVSQGVLSQANITSIETGVGGGLSLD